MAEFESQSELSVFPLLPPSLRANFGLDTLSDLISNMQNFAIFTEALSVYKYIVISIKINNIYTYIYMEKGR